MAPLLSAALIVRDEAEHLRRCLESLAGLVDEIVVVDTGSTDASPEVAAGFGAVVVRRPWDDDFSAARNHGLDHVSGTWVLYIDADEYVAEADARAVRDELESDTRHVAYRLRLRANAGFTPYWEYRVWRHRSDLRFRGVIHESHVRAIRRIAEAEALLVGHLDVLVDHDGYEGDQTAKHLRNLPLLEAQIRQDPKRTYLWDHLARVHQALGHDDEALAAWRHAVALVREEGVQEQVDCLCYLDLIVVGASAGRPDPELVGEADRLFPENVLILWAGALDAAARGSHAEVIDRIDRMWAVDPEETARAALTVNQRILTDWGHHARGLAWFHLGDFAAAAADFSSAETAAPEVAEYRVKRLLADARLR
ncbi:MAG TPA: glycosyltransferase [Acidimicrobiales bacterium]|nr:glycosyltransferase [Acidimicrobiales bacterium]